jgi:hypothetical protein
MGNDDAKRLILARRARFVAAALAGVAAACGGETEESPRVCLSVLADSGPGDASGSDAEPQPCLAPLPPDASTDAASDADAGPQPCLSPLPPDGGDGG